MPLYDYKCTKCGKKTEEMKRMEARDEEMTCECGGDVKRCLTLCSGFQPFPAGWWRDIGPKPLYIEDRTQLKEACDKHGCYSQYLDG